MIIVMRATVNTSSDEKEELARSFHIVTPQSRGKPLCGEQDTDAEIGAYVEHLNGSGDFVREVFGKAGKPETACARCLTLYPSVLL